MNADVRKLHIIEAVLKTDDEGVLLAMEKIVTYESSKPLASSNRFGDLVGMLTAEDAADMKEAIEEHFEKISADDWK
jgi:hypothetical protein